MYIFIIIEAISLFLQTNHINGLETEKPMTRKTMKETKKSDNFYITYGMT